MEKSIKYNRETKDFEVKVNGEIIGYAPTFLQGEQMADAHAYRLLAAAAPAAVEAAASAPSAPAAAPVNPANITRQAVAAVLVEARAKLASDLRWVNALNKAAVELESGAWAFDGRRLVISSRTTQGKRYRVEGARCECAAAHAGRICWHIAAGRLLQRAAERAAQSAA